MANYNISWTPATNGSTISQNVEYKKSVDSTWTVSTNVSAVTNIAVINSLLDNVVYDFRVSSLCDFGGPSPSSPFSLIKFICPTVTLSKTTNQVSYSFTHPGGSISSVTVDLLSSSSVVLQTQTPAAGTPVTGVFNGLTPGTAYKVRVKLIAGSFNQTCSAQDITTDNLVCEAPTGLTATIA